MQLYSHSSCAAVILQPKASRDDIALAWDRIEQFLKAHLGDLANSGQHTQLTESSQDSGNVA